MTDDTTVTRRRLLGATGAAMAGLGAATPAGASHYEPGTRVVLDVDIQSFLNACPNEDYGPLYEAGNIGRVWDSCVDDVVGEMLYYEPEAPESGRLAWVPAEHVSLCC